MKITDVRVRAVQDELIAPFTNALGTPRPVSKRTWTVTIVEVFTDEGITGVVANDDFDELSRQLIANQLKPVIVGEDPLNYERVWRKMFGERGGWRHASAKGEAIRAMSALDCAIWDIIGKATATPVYRLLGGYRDTVPCYASGGQYRSLTSHPEELRHLESEVQGYMEIGYKAVKIRAGRDITQDYERVKVVRDITGPDVDLMIDFNTSLTYYGGVSHAIKFMRALEDHNPYWFEDPLLMDDVSGMKQVSDALDTAIATGEAEQTLWGFRDLIVNRAVDILLPDAVMCGGVTAWKQIATMADAFRIPVAAHCVERVHLHCVAAIPNGLMVEMFRPLDKGRINYEKNPITPNHDGALELSQEPGFGIELDEAYIKKHLVDVR
jgi:D-arabinonate dehydratase